MTPYTTENRPMPNRWTGRDSGAMNVYSIVPSQRSHATVSVTISKMIPRYAQIDPADQELRRQLVLLLQRAPTPFAMNTIVSVFANVQRGTRPPRGSSASSR